MPRPKGSTNRRSSSRTAPQQNTLAFKTKITKPGATLSSLGKEASKKASKLVSEDISSAKSATATPEPAPAVLHPEEPQAPTTVEAAIEQQVETTRNAEPTQDERAAEKLSDAQVKAYWQEKEDSRIFPRVHQQGLSLHDKVLHEFDLSSQYGPCIGIARTKRWMRARKLGLDPPIEVLAVLIKEDKKAKGGMQVAYLDELMGSKQLVEEVR